MGDLAFGKSSKSSKSCMELPPKTVAILEQNVEELKSMREKAQQMKASVQMVASCREANALLQEQPAYEAVLLSYPHCSSQTDEISSLLATYGMPAVVISEQMEPLVWNWGRQAGASDLIAHAQLWRLPAVLQRECSAAGCSHRRFPAPCSLRWC